MAKSGQTCQIKVIGAGVDAVGEATSSSDDTTYQITDTAKRVLDRTGTIRVHVFTANHAAESGTTTTNIKVTGHGLVTNDLVYNITRSAARLVTYVDVDNFTVAAVTSQTDGDSIAFYPTAADGDTTKNRIEGKVTFGAALARTVRISGTYLPLSAVAEAHSYSYVLGQTLVDKTDFGQTHKYRTKIRTIKDISGSLAEWVTTDTTLMDYLIAGTIVILEFWSDTGGTFDVKCWALLSTRGIQAVADGEFDGTVEFEGSRDADNNVVAFG